MTPEYGFKGVVRLTRVGSGYLIFTLVIGFAAINSGNNSLYIGLAFMLGGLIVSGAASHGGLRHLELHFIRLEEAWAGDLTRGEMTASNSSRVWNVRDVVLTSAELSSPLFFPVIRRRETLRVTGGFLFTHRGRVELKTVELYTRYPFGLFLKRRRVSLRGEAIIYPRLLDPPELNTANVLRGQSGRSDLIGPGSEIRSFREYVRGDSLRQVHWKKTASLGRWIMKQTEVESNQSIEIAVDPILPPEGTPAQFERMISEAATYLLDALEKRYEVALHLPAGTIRGGGDAVRRPMFEALALLQPSSEGWAEWLSPETIVFSLRETRESRSA
ncbi:MAG: DUF58 domain-containing protein [Acidobacteriota bacterium]